MLGLISEQIDKSPNMDPLEPISGEDENKKWNIAANIPQKMYDIKKRFFPILFSKKDPNKFNAIKLKNK